MITINSFETGLTQDERAKLYPTCGFLNPDGLQELRRTDNYDAVRDVGSRYPVSENGAFLRDVHIGLDSSSNTKSYSKEQESMQATKQSKTNSSNMK